MLRVGTSDAKKHMQTKILNEESESDLRLNQSVATAPTKQRKVKPMNHTPKSNHSGAISNKK